MIRRYQQGDHLAIGHLFHHAVHRLAAEDYTPEQIRAWAPFPVDREAWSIQWKQRCERKNPFVFVIDDQVAGFIELDPDGHIDCAYVHPEHARRGVMSALMVMVKEVAKAAGNARLFAEVSITARPFFEKHGFSVIRENFVTRHEVVLMNYLMETGLDGAL